MKTIARLDRDIVTFDENALFIYDIDFFNNTSVYNYRLNLNANIVRGIREQAKLVKVEIVGVPRNKSGQRRGRRGRTSPNNFVKSIKTSYSRGYERRKNRKKSLQKIYSRSRMIRYRMSSKRMDLIYKTVDVEDVEQYLSKRKVLQLTEKSMLTPEESSDAVKPIFFKIKDSNDLSPNAESNEEFKNYDDKQFQNDCLSLIRTKYVDPTRMLTLRHNIIKRAESRRGVNSSDLAKRKRRQLNSNSKVGKFFLKNTSPPDKEAVVETVTVEEVKMPFVFNINSRHLNKFSKIIIKYDVIDKHGGVVQRSQRVLNHKKALNDFNVPILPPAIRVLPRPDAFNIVGVRPPRHRNAKFIKGFKVYKKVYSSTNSDNKKNFIKLFEGSFNLSRSSRRRYFKNRSIPRIRNAFYFRDIDVSSNPIVYRVVPVDFLNREHSCFKTVVIKPSPPKKSRCLETNRSLFIAAHGSNNQESITVSVTNFDASVIMIETFRRNLSLKEKKRRPHKVDFGASLREFIENPTQDFSFDDKKVKEGNIYEYSFRFTFKDGFKSFASEVLIKKFIPKSNDILVSIQKVNYGQNEKGKIDVSFIPTTNKSENQKESDLTRKFLSKINADQLFAQEAIAEELKDNVPELISFRITRRNLATNEEVTFDQSAPNSVFIDSANADKIGVPTVEYGSAYKYTVQAYKINPKIAFRNSRFDFRSPRTGKRYKRDFSKFRNNLTLRLSTIKPFTKQATRINYNKNPFLLGETGSYDELTVNLSDQRPKIIGGDVEVDAVNRKLLSWEIDEGDFSTIDSFLILCHIDKFRIPCFVAQGYKDGKDSFDYLEDFTRNIIASIGYSIIPIYNNFEYGAEYFLGTVDSTRK